MIYSSSCLASKSFTKNDPQTMDSTLLWIGVLLKHEWIAGFLLFHGTVCLVFHQKIKGEPPINHRLIGNAQKFIGDDLLIYKILFVLQEWDDIHFKWPVTSMAKYIVNQGGFFFLVLSFYYSLDKGGANIITSLWSSGWRRWWDRWCFFQGLRWFLS